MNTSLKLALEGFLDLRGVGVSEWLLSRDLLWFELYLGCKLFWLRLNIGYLLDAGIFGGMYSLLLSLTIDSFYSSWFSWVWKVCICDLKWVAKKPSVLLTFWLKLLKLPCGVILYGYSSFWILLLSFNCLLLMSWGALKSWLSLSTLILAGLLYSLPEFIPDIIEGLYMLIMFLASKSR